MLPKGTKDENANRINKMPVLEQSELNSDTYDRSNNKLLAVNLFPVFPKRFPQQRTAKTPESSIIVKIC